MRARAACMRAYMHGCMQTCMHENVYVFILAREITIIFCDDDIHRGCISGTYFHGIFLSVQFTQKNLVS